LNSCPVVCFFQIALGLQQWPEVYVAFSSKWSLNASLDRFEIIGVPGWRVPECLGRDLINWFFRFIVEGADASLVERVRLVVGVRLMLALVQHINRSCVVTVRHIQTSSVRVVLGH